MSWKIAPRLQEAAEARPHAAGSDSLWEVPEKAVHEALKAKPKLQWPCWRGQDRGAAAKTMGSWFQMGYVCQRQPSPSEPRSYHREPQRLAVELQNQCWFYFVLIFPVLFLFFLSSWDCVSPAIVYQLCVLCFDVTGCYS